MRILEPWEAREAATQLLHALECQWAALSASLRRRRRPRTLRASCPDCGAAIALPSPVAVAPYIVRTVQSLSRAAATLLEFAPRPPVAGLPPDAWERLMPKQRARDRVGRAE